MSQSDRRAFLKGTVMFAASTVAAKAALAEEPRDSKPDPGESRSGDKPNPISTGPSQAEGIAKFACEAKYADLTTERRERLKVSVLDSLACAISALGAPPIEACLAQAKEFGGSERSMHPDRRRASQRRLCGVVQHGAGPLHRLHG